jgi:Na+/melibiose symporter-like transporter
MGIKSVINKVYFKEEELKQRDYEKSRKLFIAESSAAVGIFSLTSGAFLSGFVKYLGGSDEINGIIGAIPAMAGVIQILSSLVFEKLRHRKFLVAILCFLYRFTLGMMFFVPFFIKGQTPRIIAVATIYLIAYCLAAFITPAASTWITDLVPMKMRGKYFATKDSISLAVSTLIVLIIGRVMDFYRGINSEYSGFLVLAIIVIILSFINFYFLSSVKEPIGNRQKVEINLKDIVRMVGSNKRFRKMIGLSSLWNLALQIGGPYFAVYMVTGLKLSYSYINIIGVIAAVFRVLVMKYWGKLADKYSWFFSTKFSIGLLGIVHFLWVFVDKGTYPVLVPLLSILSALAWSGINISLFNIQFLYAPEKGRTAYLGVSAAIGGIIGFLSTLLGSFILRGLKNFKFTLGSVVVGNMQIVLSLSGVLLVITAVYIHFIMEKTYYKKV